MTKQQFKNLPAGKKISYLLEKYLAAVVLGVFLVSAISTLFYEEHIKVQPLLQVDMINVNKNSPDGSSFDEFLETKGYSDGASQVKLEKRYQFGGEHENLPIMPDHVMICNQSVGKTDIYFWNTSYIEQTLAGTLLDLRTVLPEEFLLENADRLIYTAPLLEGGYPCGIALLDNQWVQENNYYGDCAVGISRKSQERELSGEFLQFIS